MMMYINYTDLIFIFYFIGFMSLCLKRLHLLMILLCMEFIVLVMYTLMIFYLNLFEAEMYFSMMFLSFSVCEGVLGLSILIKMVRLNGNDYFQVLNFL